MEPSPRNGKIFKRGSGLGRKTMLALLILLWLFVTSTQGYVPGGEPGGVVSGPPRERKLPALVQTAGGCFDTGSQGLSEIFYRVGASLSRQGWDVEIVPYSCAIRTTPRTGESVWYRVSGENLLATKPGTVAVIVAIPADEICRSPAAKRPVVPPEEMILYVAGACSDADLEGVALALVSGSWQGGAGLESLQRRMDCGGCPVIVVEAFSSSDDPGDALLLQLLPRSPVPSASYLWRYPDHDPEAARRNAVLLARHLRRTLADLSCGARGTVVVLDTGTRILTAGMAFLRGLSLSLVGLCVLILLILPEGRSCLGDIRGFYDLASFICLSLPPILLPAVYVQLKGEPLSQSTCTKFALTLALLLPFGWRLAAWLRSRRDRPARPQYSSEPGPGPGPADFRPFACFFLGGLAAGSAATLSVSRPRAGPVLGYVLVMMAFLASFIASGRKGRTSRVADAALVFVFAFPAILDPGMCRGVFGLRSYIESLSRLEREALGPVLVASLIAAEVTRTARLKRGKHERKPPGWWVILNFTLPVFLCAMVWAIPSPDSRGTIVTERVLVSVPPSSRTFGPCEAGPPDPGAGRYLLPPAGKPGWADLELSYRMAGNTGDTLELELTLRASFREPPAFVRVTLKDLSSRWTARNTGPLVVDASDFLGISGRAYETLEGTRRQASFVRWRPHERDMVSRFFLHASPRSRLRVSVEAVYTGKTCFSPVEDDRHPDGIPIVALSSWETWLEIP